MQFSALFVALFAALSFVAASPLAPVVPDGCDLLKCAAAFAGSIESCASAISDDGLDPFEDADCLADAADTVHNAPSACKGCF